MKEYDEVMCPDCKGYAKLVPAAEKFPKQQGSSKRGIWWCRKCGTYAESDKATGRPTTGLGLPALHQIRARLALSLRDSKMGNEGLRQAMRMKPWEFRIPFFTWMQCEDALKLLQQYKPPEDFDLEEDLLL